MLAFAGKLQLNIAILWRETSHPPFHDYIWTAPKILLTWYDRTGSNRLLLKRRYWLSNAKCVRCPCIFYDPVSDTIKRRGGYRGIVREDGVDTGVYLRGNPGSRVWKWAGTKIYSIGYQNSNFKIGQSLFGCAEKYTEQSTYCAMKRLAGMWSLITYHTVFFRRCLDKYV